MSQQIGMHEAYRIARSCGYKKDQPVSYQVMTAIVASAYQKGKEEAWQKVSQLNKGRRVFWRVALFL